MRGNTEMQSQNPSSPNAKAQSKPAPGWQRGLSPVDPEYLVALLTSCLALVRPVGMTPMEVDAWLMVAADELSDLPADILEIGCGHARRTCTHHAQIIPAIIKETEPMMRTRREMAAMPKLTIVPRPALPRRDMTQADVDAMQPFIRDLGIAAGWLQRDDAGNVTLTPNPRGEAA